MGMGGCEQQARLEDSPGCSSVGSRGHDDTGNQECGFHVLLWVSGPSVGASQAIFDLLPTAALVVWYYFTSVFEKRELKLKNIRTLAPAEVGLDPGLSVPRSPCCGEGSTRAPPGVGGQPGVSTMLLASRWAWPSALGGVSPRVAAVIFTPVT